MVSELVRAVGSLLHVVSRSIPRHNVRTVRLMRVAVGFEARRSAAVALAFLSTSLVEARPYVPVSVVPAPAICRTAGSCIRW